MRKTGFLALGLFSSLAIAFEPYEQQTISSDITIQNQVYQLTDDLVESQSILESCSSCISLLQLVQKMSYFSEKFLINTLVKACKRTKKVDDDVCEGVIREQAPILRKVLPSMTVSGRDGHLMCAAILNSCPYPEVDEWNVTFPKPKNQDYKKATSVGKTFTVLQLSDWHIDPDYQAGTETYCSKPICCRSEYTDYSNITKESSIWGEYSCDTSLDLIKSLLEYIPTVEPTIEFGIMTGDIPPHEVWNTLPVIKTQLIQDESYRLLHSYFDSPFLLNSMLYPAVGNHESAPTNNFPLFDSNVPNEIDKHFYNLRWLYKSLAHSWKGWLNARVNPFVESNTGSYALRPVKGLKLISLNTNFCYVLNLWLYEQPANKDPNYVLAWLIDELQDAEDRNERVWIIGHIAPGDTTCFHDYSNYYYQIVDRYSHIIAAQFFGHTHKDELSLFYGVNKNQTAKDAVSVGYIAPSVTPFLDLNPGFRTYKVDTKTFEIVDVLTYIADLDQAEAWVDGPNWHLEYSAREAFNSSRAKLDSSTSPLSAEWWHNVTEDMEEGSFAFDKYYQYSWKSSPLAEDCDEECKKNIICGIRAGKSELRCDFESDVFGKETYKPQRHNCAFNLQSIDSII